MNMRMLNRLELERDLRQSIKRNELRVFFQPAASASTGEYSGVEALVRWEHPEYGLVSPADFIPIAEETGLIVEIGEWVLAESCRQGAAWSATLPGDRSLSVSVNLSARQFQQGDLVERVAAILAETGFPPAQLTLEITESTIMEDAEQTTLLLARLKALGVTIAIDDFGTGYSSLAYLKRFSVDVIKIDRSFVAALSDEPDDSILIAGIIKLAHDLGLRVVAEGVETADQLRRLDELGCDLVQGYYFARPLPPLEAYMLLRNDHDVEAVA
jgi:EAL domain-containing protein (putative c-di-GMP-specific phosphodiesterase class I)